MILCEFLCLFVAKTVRSFRRLDPTARSCGLGQERQEAKVRRRLWAYHERREAVTANTRARSAVGGGLGVVLYVGLQREIESIAGTALSGKGLPSRGSTLPPHCVPTNM